jgi:replicative DNA helicase
MTEPLASLTEILDRTDATLRAGQPIAPTTWPTGFVPLDGQLGGGLRVGELVLLGGPQGLGKTTWAIQVARNVARAGGRVMYFSFEHEELMFLERMIAQSAFEAEGLEAPTTRRLRDRFQRAGATGSVAGMSGLLQGLPGADVALKELAELGDRFLVHESSGRTTDVAMIRAAVEALPAGPAPLVVIDYLQKVKVPGGSYEEEERVGHVVESLKDLALDLDIPVLAVVAADKAGLASGKRMRVTNLRGSSALAYEADTVLLLNNKYDVVARQHLVYDLGNAERFRQWAVLSIEKNRNGLAGVDMEFRKRFAQSRFEPEGRLVTEQLVDERVFVE